MLSSLRILAYSCLSMFSTLLVIILAGIVTGSIGVHYGLTRNKCSDKLRKLAGIICLISLCFCFVPGLNVPSALVSMTSCAVVLTRCRTVCNHSQA